MRDLIISDEERKILREPAMVGDVKVFFPHGITVEQFPKYKALWDKLLNASEVDDGVVGRVRELLLQMPASVQKEQSLLAYNCYGAVLYALGIKGFNLAYEIFPETGGSLKIPLNGMAIFDRSVLKQNGFREVPQLEEQQGRGLVLLESSLGLIANHTGVYLGNSNGDAYFFHKPYPCVPDIKPLDTLVEAWSSFVQRNRVHKAKVTPSFWQIG